MMLNKHNDMAIIIPFVVVMVYLAGKGLRGYICFVEAIFWSVIIVGLFVAIFCVGNFDITQMLDFSGFKISGSVTETTRSVLIRGYVLLIAFSMMEFVMMLYIRIKNRQRGMLLISVGAAFIVAAIASFFVIAVLGWHAIYSGTKSILNIVGTFEFPSGNMARLGILACFLLMAYGIAAIQIHFVVSIDVISGFAGDKGKSNVYRCVWGIVIILLYMAAEKLLSTEYAYEYVVKYMAVIDIPLSIIIPALLGQNGNKNKKILTTAVMLFSALLVSGCSYKSIEDVDYATVVILDSGANTAEGVYDYTFVIDTLETEKSDSVTKQVIWNMKGKSFEDVCRIYNNTHNNTIDLSHVEYLVVTDESTLYALYPELMKEFATKYVNVIYEKNLMEKIDSRDVRGYLDAHYEGKCLAAIDIYDKGKTEYR
ncbi:MAG: GerAB/ArcD/ProY family transporter, partial [Coprococcus sp.]